MKQLLYTATALTLLLSTTLTAGEQTVYPDKAQKLSIVIYNADRALVSDTRAVQLTTGVNDIAFSGISDQIIPQSALLNGNNIQTLEQNFNYDLLSYESLMQKAVGSIVNTETVNPATGEKTVGTAKLLAYNNSSAVLEINGKIEANFSGRILFNKIPENLRAQPTLVMRLDTQKTEKQPLELNYLTGGLNWNANYVGQLNTDETHMNLNGFVTLTNNTSTDFKNARLQLVAGDVNIVQEFVQPRYKNNMMLKAAAPAMTDAIVENLSDFYLYTLPRATDILSRQTKQVALLSTAAVPVQKSYEFDNQLRPAATPYKNINPSVFVSFTNTAENKLGLALPKGVVRLYKENNAGELLFVGEDRIFHTAKQQTVRLKTGEAFDVYADAIRTAFTKMPDKSIDATYQIVVKNMSNAPKTVSVYENFAGSFNIVTETHVSTKITSNRVQWSLTVPAEGEETLTYRVQIKND